MKTLLVVLTLVSLATPVFAGERVRGHWKDTNRDGVKDTYVEPYNRSDRNNNPYDNYSTKGNVNAYTGEKGYVDPDKSKDNSYQPYNPYKGC